MKLVKVVGKNNENKVFIYALSTCAWCKLTKQFLRDNNIEYDYIDVDLCNYEDKETIRRDILSKGGSLSFPTIIINDNILITGFKQDRLKEALKI